MQSHKFLDEIGYKNTGQDDELIGKADALYKQRLQKVGTLCGTLRLLLSISKAVKRTTSSTFTDCWLQWRVIYNCLDCHSKGKFAKRVMGITKLRSVFQICMENWQHTRQSLLLGWEWFMWRMQTATTDHSIWLFKVFIHWLLRDKMNDFTLMVHSDARLDKHYLFHYLIKEFGLTVDPIYSGNKLLHLTVKKSANNTNYLIRGVESAQFEIITKTIWFRHIGLQKGIFSLLVWSTRTTWQISWYFLLCSDEAAGIKMWHQQQQDKVFNFRKEIVDYCLQDVNNLLAAVQVAVHEDFDLVGFDGMAECCTIASKTMLFFRHGFLKDNTIGVISQTGVAGRHNYSYESLLCFFYKKSTTRIYSMYFLHKVKKFDWRLLLTVFMKQLLQCYNSMVVFGMDIQSVTETELQKIQSMKKLSTSSIPKLFDEHNSLKMPVTWLKIGHANFQTKIVSVHMNSG